jgi:hypothetical protein
MTGATTKKKTTKKRQTKKKTRGRSLGVQKKAPKNTPPLVEEFIEIYAEVVQEGHRHAEHTATEGWQELYGDHLDEDDKTRKAIADQLKEFAKVIVKPDIVVDPKDLKPLNDARKDAAEHLAALLNFREDVVSKVSDVAKRANEIVNKYRNLARQTENDAPLHNSGLITAMDNAIKQSPVVHWDKKTGVITVEEQDVS